MGLTPCADRNSLALGVFRRCSLLVSSMRHKSMGKDRCIGSFMFARRFKGLVGKFVCNFSPFFFSCRSIQNRSSVTLKGPRGFRCSLFTALLFLNAKCKELEK